MLDLIKNPCGSQQVSRAQNERMEETKQKH